MDPDLTYDADLMIAKIEFEFKHTESDSESDGDEYEIWEVSHPDGSIFYFTSEEAGNKFIEYDSKTSYRGQSLFDAPRLLMSSRRPIHFRGYVQSLNDVIIKHKREAIEKRNDNIEKIKKKIAQLQSELAALEKEQMIY
jgi:hypothetical protein